MENPTDPKIVILGAGFAGVRVALDLAKAAPSLNVCLINKNPYHEFNPDFYEVATATLPEPRGKQFCPVRFESLKGSVAILLEAIFQKTKVKIITDTVIALDLKLKKIFLKSGEKIDYDILVLALGSQTNYFGIPNLEKYSLTLKSVDDALNIRNQIDEIFANKKVKEKIDIIVGGGGFTGCELVGELVGYLNTLAKIHAHKRYDVKLSVVEANPGLIQGASSSIQRAVETRLRSLDIDIYLNSKIILVEQSKLHAEPALTLSYDVLIWTAGIRSNNLVDKLTGVHTEKTCLIIDKSLRLILYRNVFAIGDIAFCYDEEKSYQAPATAQIAIDQGGYVAKNIVRLIKNEPLLLYKLKKPKFIVPLGGKFAVGEFSGLHLEGIEAWWLKRASALRYFASVLPVTKAFQLWSSGNKFFVGNDLGEAT